MQEQEQAQRRRLKFVRIPAKRLRTGGKPIGRLAIHRRPGQQVLIRAGGEDILISVTSIEQDESGRWRAQLTIEAATDVEIVRAELAEGWGRDNDSAVPAATAATTAAATTAMAKE